MLLLSKLPEVIIQQASFSEVEKVLQERVVVEPEPGLTPEVVKLLQERIANQKMQLNRT